MCSIPTSQGRPETKYLLQGKVREGKLIGLPSSSLGVSLLWRTLFWAHVTIGHVSYVGSVSRVPGQKFGREAPTILDVNPVNV